MGGGSATVDGAKEYRGRTETKREGVSKAKNAGCCRENPVGRESALAGWKLDGGFFSTALKTNAAQMQ